MPVCKMLRIKMYPHQSLMHPLGDHVFRYAHISRTKGDIIVDTVFKQLGFRKLEDQPHLLPDMA